MLQSVDIESDFSFLIWSYELNVMAKRRAKDQISNSCYSSRQLNPLLFINLIGPTMFLGGATSPKEQHHEEKWDKFPNVWKKIIGDKLYPNFLKNYTMGKFSKCTYWKWSCIFNLKLWIKSYGEKNNWESNFQLPPRKRGLSCLGEQRDMEIWPLVLIFANFFGS
jgi:hypothetical protein